MLGVFFFFFFQAEDGIRDGTVTGVQTCALPISQSAADCAGRPAGTGTAADAAGIDAIGAAHCGARQAGFIAPCRGGSLSESPTACGGVPWHATVYPGGFRGHRGVQPGSSATDQSPVLQLAVVRMRDAVDTD